MSTDIIGQGGSSGRSESRTQFLSDLINGLRQFARSIGAGMAAASEYKRLDRMNDAQLEREGLKREEISRAVFHRNYY